MTIQGTAASMASSVASSNTAQAMDNALANLINKSVTGIDTATAFLSTQIPDVIQQLLIWHAVKSGLLFLVGVILFVVPIVAVYKGIKNKSAWIWDSRFHNVEATIVPACLVPIFGVPLIFSNMDWLQILVAPKLYLIEYAVHLVK